MEQQQAEKTIHITVRLEESVFRRFAVFDTFKRQKRWRSPAIFAGIMLAFAAVCFCLRGKSQSALIGSVLAVIGLGLPVVYFVMFFSSLKEKIRNLRLPKRVYDVDLSDRRDGVQIHSVGEKEENVTLNWDQMYAAYRNTDCIYLYVMASRAFLLPNEQASVSPNKLWRFLNERMPQGKCYDLTK